MFLKATVSCTYVVVISFYQFLVFQEVYEHMCFIEVAKGFGSQFQLQRGSLRFLGHVLCDFRVFY